MKKVFTKRGHVYLVETVESEGNQDCLYGQNVLLSIYVKINTKTGARSGAFHYSDKLVRVVRHDDIERTETPDENDLAFYEYLKEHRNVDYSRKLADEFHLNDYLIFTETVDKEA